MPKENFWRSFDRDEGDPPDFTIEWGACDSPKHEGDNCHGMVMHGGLAVNPSDTSNIDRVISTLRRVKRYIEKDTFEGRRLRVESSDEASDIDRE